MGDGSVQDGLVDERWWRGRQDAYLAHATQVFQPASPLSVLEHVERHRRDPSHPLRTDRIGEAELAVWFARIDGWADCADFDILRLMHLWFGSQALLPPAVVAAVGERFVGFKYWFTEPTPPGVVDNRWYWSENHRLIFHAIEHLAGQIFPDVVFPSDGRTGAEHRATATERLHAWFDEKARWGFSEWHSDVYYAKDLAPLVTLVEWSDDPVVVARATAFLDLLLLDLALHLHQGNMGATHGRSYMKDKSRAQDQPVFAAAKLCFDDTSLPWSPPEADAETLLPRNESGTLMARAARYRPPEVIRRIATSAQPMVDRERMGLPIDPSGPIIEHPTREDGLSYTDPEMAAFWWDRSALTPWQLIELTMDTLDRHDLWEADLFSAAKGLRDFTGGDRAVARQLAVDLDPMINSGLLVEVDTICYRTEHVMLAGAQSYRPGCGAYQHHVWQATLDEQAVVFTTHPGNGPVPDPSGWAMTDRYWTGGGTLPRAVQHGPATVVQYAPAYPAPELEVLSLFAYEPETHAYFPTEHFDEVRTVEGPSGRWTVGRRGGGFVGLWSWRPVRWRQHDPAVTFTNGLTQPFDLVAEGGATNVWIAEVGDVTGYEGFDAFCDALRAATVEVRDLGDDGAAHRGFEVVYASPGAGRLEVGWTGPLRVEGEEVPVGGHPRFDNPWVQAAMGQAGLEVRDGGWSLTLDLSDGTRLAGGPGSGRPM